MDCNDTRTAGYSSRLALGLTLLIMLVLGGTFTSRVAYATGAPTIVTPSTLDGWTPANVRTNGSVAITGWQQRGGAPDNRGSLEFTTNTATLGQDKADYVKLWGVVPGRTLGNLSGLSYEFYRDSSSTTAQHFAPVLRLYYQTSSGETGLLIWEQVYNGYSGGVPTNSWVSANMLGGTFWMRAFGPGRTVERFDVTLAQWAAGEITSNGHVLGTDTKIIGIDVGVGSGWGATFRGAVDNVVVGFDADTVSANFEPNPACTTLCYVDDSGSNANGGTSPADAMQTIQAALDRVSPGGEVVVAAGTYPARFSVAKPVTLRGTQAGTLAKGRSGDESIIRLDASVTQTIDLAADAITIDGFTINATGFSQPWVITALGEPGDGRVADLVLRNTIFTGNPGVNSFPGGLYLATTDRLLIEGNYFNDLGQHAVFLGNQSTGAVYRNNDSFGNYNSNFSAHGGPHTNVLIENNRAVDDSLILFNVDEVTIRGNSFDGNPTAFTSSRVYLGGGSSAITIVGNSFKDIYSTAVSLFDAGFGYGANSGPVTISENSITSSVAGLSGANAIVNVRDTTGAVTIVRNRLTFFDSLPSTATTFTGIAVGGPLASALIEANELDGGSPAGAPRGVGVLFRDTLPSDASLAVRNNSIAGFSTGITANNVGAATIELNSLAGSPTGLSSITSVAAERNWWGSATGPTSASNAGGTGAGALGSADVSPWLCSGSDQSADIGFQTAATALCYDNFPPIVTVPSNIVVKATSAAGAVVTYDASATDTIDGPLTPTCAPVSGSTFAPGATTVTCTATDASGKTGSASFQVTVSFDRSGFYQPIDMNDVVNTVRRGSVVPVKFEIFGANSVEIVDTSAIKAITFKGSSDCTASAATDTIETLAASPTVLRYDAGAGQFIYNWKTPTTPGCYSLTMTTTDAQSISAIFRIR